jgi:hypothetical protein
MHKRSLISELIGREYRTRFGAAGREGWSGCLSGQRARLTTECSSVLTSLERIEVERDEGFPPMRPARSSADGSSCGTALVRNGKSIDWGCPASDFVDADRRRATVDLDVCEGMACTKREWKCRTAWAAAVGFPGRAIGCGGGEYVYAATLSDAADLELRRAGAGCMGVFIRYAAMVLPWTAAGSHVSVVVEDHVYASRFRRVEPGCAVILEVAAVAGVCGPVPEEELERRCRAGEAIDKSRLR